MIYGGNLVNMIFLSTTTGVRHFIAILEAARMTFGSFSKKQTHSDGSLSHNRVLNHATKHVIFKYV